jgi:hypothetical protein
MLTNLFRRKLMLIATLLAVAVSGASCGGTKTVVQTEPPGPEDDFLGRWEILDPRTTAFTLTCPSPATPQAYLQWIHLVFEHGTVTDLNETGGINDQFGCTPAISYNINGNAATVVNPDPYLGGPPFCDALAFDSTGAAVALLEFSPNADWTFELSPLVANKPPQGTLKGSATVTPLVPDASGNLVAQPACTYSSGNGGDEFFRMTQP